ncbi:MAG: SurA N-terminal domain-containing protein [Verrucomicrobiae bacterium]|nr:SurA N-terminal domain-containing protein [Verrucomicrobiae bacterium]
MLELLRKHQYGIMLVVAIVVIFAFAVMPNRRNSYVPGKTLIVAGESFDEKQQGAIAAGLQIAGSLGGDPQMKIAYGLARLAPLMKDPNGNPMPQDTLANVIVLRKQAKELGVEVTDADVDKYIQSLQPFQTDGKFDRAKWTDRMEMMGIAKEGEKGNDKGSVMRSRLYAGLKDALLLDKVAELMASSLPPTEAQIDWEYWRDKQETTVMTVTFETKEFEDIEIPEEEIKTYYEDNKGSATLMTEEQRAFTYALLPLAPRPVAPPNSADLPAEQQVSQQAEYQEKVDAWEKDKERMNIAATRLADLMVAEGRDPAKETFASLVEQSFNYAREKIAEEKAMESEEHDEDADAEGDAPAADPAAPDELVTPEVKTTELFAQSDAPDDLKSAYQFLSAAFSRRVITDEDKIGDAITTPQGYYFYEIKEIKAPAEQPLEDVRETIVAALKATKAADALSSGVAEYREKIVAALEEGKAFEAVSTELGKTPEEVGPFSLANPIKTGLNAQIIADIANGRPENPNPNYYRPKISPTNVGEISEPFDTPTGKLLVYVVRRELPEDPAKVEEDKKSMKTRLAARSGTSHFNKIFEAWFTEKKKEMFDPLENGPGGSQG